MIASTDIYNKNPFSFETTLVLGKDNYKKTNELPTTKNGICFHYEFWQNDGGLYACIHCDHPHADLNFINFINSLYNGYTKQKLTNNGFLNVNSVALKGQSDMGNRGTNTHVINIKCKVGDPKYNADLMRNIIKYSINQLSNY